LLRKFARERAFSRSAFPVFFSAAHPSKRRDCGTSGFSHQEAVEHIAQTTIDNIIDFAATKMRRNPVRA
jgi:hypothetical protein